MEQESSQGKVYFVEDRSLRVKVAAIWGVLIGFATLYPEAVMPPSPHMLIWLIQSAFMCLIVPGLIAAAAVGTLEIGGLVNGLLHFGLCWLLFPVASKLWKKIKPKPV